MLLLLHHLLSLALVSLALGLPTITLENAAEVYVTHTTDDDGIERRSTQVIDKGLHQKLIYYSEYAAAAYCPPQQGKIGGKVCATLFNTRGLIFNRRVIGRMHAS